MTRTLIQPGRRPLVLPDHTESDAATSPGRSSRRDTIGATRTTACHRNRASQQVRGQSKRPPAERTGKRASLPRPRAPAEDQACDGADQGLHCSDDTHLARGRTGQTECQLLPRRAAVSQTAAPTRVMDGATSRAPATSAASR